MMMIGTILLRFPNTTTPVNLGVTLNQTLIQRSQLQVYKVPLNLDLVTLLVPSDLVQDDRCLNNNAPSEHLKYRDLLNHIESRLVLFYRILHTCTLPLTTATPPYHGNV
jgi:hypothetical protein